MNYLSVCSGIEAASAAWHVMGWRPLGFAEIEKFPATVLAHRFPEVPNLGDITGFSGWNGFSPDLLVGGTPCQSFSVAGLRQGLADPRGNLMLTYLAIAARYRPRWLVWENVPGVLSADEGRAFGTLVQGMAELGYHAAWRALDAEYVRVDGYGMAVPQRRRRVFVVGYLGDWRRAAAVLFDAQSLRWNSAPRREKREGAAPTISARTKGGGGLGTDFDCDGGLIEWPASVSPTMNAHFGDKMGLEDQHALNGAGMFVPTVTNALTMNNGQRNEVSDMANGLIVNPVAQTLTRRAESSGKGGYAGRRQEDDTNIVAFSVNAGGDKTSSGSFGKDFSPTLTKAHTFAANIERRIRRLTPTECERLQGFPDGWTNVPYRGKPAADGPRYKALGNSMAVNVMRWIGRRIEMVDAI